MRKKIISLILLMLLILLFPFKIKMQFDGTTQFTDLIGENKISENSRGIELKLASSGDQYAVINLWEWSKYDYWRVDYLTDDQVVDANLYIAIGNLVILHENLQDSNLLNIEYFKDTSSILIKVDKKFIYWKILLYWLIYIGIGAGIIYLVVNKCRYDAIYEKSISTIQNIPWRNLLFPSIFILVVGVTVVTILSYKEWELMISSAEMIFVTLAEILIYCIFFVKIRDKKFVSLFCILIIPVLILSVERLTSFYTVDEPYNVYRLLDFPQNVRLWFNHTSMLSNVIMNYSLRIFLIIFKDNGIITIEEFCKLIHWLYGILMVFVIVDIAVDKIIGGKYNVSKKRKIFNYLFIVYILLLLPTNELALKNYNNYDMFSLMFGVLSFEYFYLAMKYDSVKYSRIAFVLSVLGFIEKINMLPMFVLCGSGFLYMSCKDKKFLVRLKQVLCLMVECYVCVVFFGTMSVYGIAQNDSPILNVLTYPFDLIGASAYRLVWKIGEVLHIGMLSSGRTFLVRFVAIIAIFWGMIVGAYVIKLTILGAKKLNLRYISQVSICLMIAIYIVGIIISYKITVYDNSKFGSFMCKVVSNYVNAIPMAVIMLLVLVLFRKEADKLLCVLLTCCATLTILIYAIIQEFAAARYMNIYICIDVLIIAILFLQMDYTKPFLLLSIGSQIFLALEILPSAPAFTFFKPIWNYSYSDNEIGMSVYWGEQIMLAGDLIEDYCLTNNIPLENIKMYCGYGGIWNGNKNNFEIIAANKWVHGDVDYGTQQSDFYVFDSQALIRNIIPYGVPDDVEPIIEIRYRGATIMRIYEGKQIENYLEKNIGNYY